MPIFHSSIAFVSILITFKQQKSRTMHDWLVTQLWNHGVQKGIGLMGKNGLVWYPTFAQRSALNSFTKAALSAYMRGEIQYAQIHHFWMSVFGITKPPIMKMIKSKIKPTVLARIIVWDTAAIARNSAADICCVHTSRRYCLKNLQIYNIRMYMLIMPVRRKWECGSKSLSDCPNKYIQQWKTNILNSMYYSAQNFRSKNQFLHTMRLDQKTWKSKESDRPLSFRCIASDKVGHKHPDPTFKECDWNTQHKYG